ncbi:MAG TPA: Ig-like domain-containing protein [Polyangiaceae bacterium]
MLSDGGKGPPPQVVWTFPANEAMGVALQQSIRVQFDRFLAPGSAVRQGVCVQSAPVGAGAPADCIGGLTPKYDPVDRVAVWIPPPLMPMTRYNVRLLAPQDENDANGIRAFDGVPLEKEFTFAFTTGDNTAMAIEPKRDITFCSLPSLCTVPTNVCSEPAVDKNIHGPNDLLGGCAGSTGSCHTPPPANEILPGPVGSVVSYTGDAGVPEAVRQLVEQSVVASETATGADPSAPRRSANDIFGQNMPVIDATNPGNSYILYKLILAMPPRCPFDPNEESANPTSVTCKASGYGALEGFTANEYNCSDFPPPQPKDPAGTCPSDAGVTPPTVVGMPGQRIPPLVEPWVPDDQWHPPAKGEYDRLRLRIRGDSMSISGFGPANATPRQDALAMSAWIAAGAVVATCTP